MLAIPPNAVSKPSSAEASSSIHEATAAEDHPRSLASSYLIDICSTSNLEERWSLTPIQNVNRVSTETDLLPEGALAAKALQTTASTTTEAAKTSSLICRIQSNNIIVGTSNDNALDPSLVAVLLRIMVQRLASRAPQENQRWRVSLPGDETDMSLDNLNTEESVRTLFSPISPSSHVVELVEMVAQTGATLGVLPRPLVHSYNLLHRGIGMVVVCHRRRRDSSLYVHRRTDTKRIFPGMYDMFVGGVSCAGEDARVTAQREVSEELGLKRALVDKSALSEPLFSCIVCTSYNRCLVTVFSYTFDSTQDEISWQQEEVAWGDFMPYDTIVESARLCIERMVESKTWPGSTPYALQRRAKGRTTDTQTVGANEDYWKTFDYVPDGLLVWEAWLQWRDGKLS